jgi:hypothetical protein
VALPGEEIGEPFSDPPRPSDDADGEIFHWKIHLTVIAVDLPVLTGIRE